MKNFHRKLYYSDEELGKAEKKENYIEALDVMKEVNQVLSEMKKEKSPGENGLTADILKWLVKRWKKEIYT